MLLLTGAPSSKKPGVSNIFARFVLCEIRGKVESLRILRVQRRQLFEVGNFKEASLVTFQHADEQPQIKQIQSLMLIRNIHSLCCEAKLQTFSSALLSLFVD